MILFSTETKTGHVDPCPKCEASHAVMRHVRIDRDGMSCTAAECGACGAPITVRIVNKESTNG